MQQPEGKPRTLGSRDEIALRAGASKAATYRQLSVIWGVTPYLIDQYSSSDDIPSVSAEFIEKNKLLDRGEHYVVTGGVPIGVPGTTNFLFVQKA